MSTSSFIHSFLFTLRVIVKLYILVFLIIRSLGIDKSKDNTVYSITNNGKIIYAEVCKASKEKDVNKEKKRCTDVE